MLFSAVLVLTVVGAELPASESIVYRTEEKGKVGYLTATIRRDSGMVMINYSSDRVVDVRIDQGDLRTLWVRKIIQGKKDFEFERRGDTIWTEYHGRHKVFHTTEPVFDRHTLDYFFRQDVYDTLYTRQIMLHLPELGLKSVRIRVAGEETVKTELGDIPCRRVLMTAKVLIFKIELAFLIEKEYPYRYVKLEDKKRKMVIFRYSR